MFTIKKVTMDKIIFFQLFKSKGYKHWGTNPNYALVDGKNIKGFYFLKQLK